MTHTRIGLLTLTVALLGLNGLSTGAAPQARGQSPAPERAGHERYRASPVPRAPWTEASWKALPCRRAPWRGAITTSVFTDDRGEYVFPPLESGRYEVWAQAVGYETARAQVTVDSARQARQAFTLHTIKDFTPQLSGIGVAGRAARGHERAAPHERDLPFQLHRLPRSHPRAAEPVRRERLARHDHVHGTE